jgi:hypothetical protein
VISGDGIAGEMALYAAAKRHDWQELASYIASGAEITPEIRKFVAAVLRGEVKRPKKRPLSSTVSSRHHDVATFVFLARRLGIKNATQKAGQNYNLGHRSVQRILKGDAASSSKKVMEALEHEITKRSSKKKAEQLLASLARVYGIK